MDAIKKSVRYVLCVPESRMFVMTHDLSQLAGDHLLRPIGGEIETGETAIEAGDRETAEETGFCVERHEKVPLRTYEPSATRIVFLFLVVVSHREAKSLHSCGDDVVSLLDYDDIVAGVYDGVPVHAEYRKRILEEVMPMIEARAVT